MDKRFENLSKERIIALLKGNEDSALFSEAQAVCRQTKGDDVQIRAILEFSNVCRCQCLYCGLRSGNQERTRYRMMPEEMLQVIGQAREAGYRTIVLQSGEDPFYTQELLVNLIRDIKARWDIAITLSIGERPKEELKAFREAGADRYLLKHETASPEIYARMHPGTSLEKRLQCLKDLKDLGFEIGSGFMVGLPGQTLEVLADDLLLLKEIGCDMAGMGPFIAHPKTPLRGSASGDPLLTCRAVAIARLLLPECNLPATTALGVLNNQAAFSAFSGGANVVMKKVTPWNVRRQYEIYPAELGEEMDILTARRQLEQQIRQLGKKPR